MGSQILIITGAGSILNRVLGIIGQVPRMIIGTMGTPASTDKIKPPVLKSFKLPSVDRVVADKKIIDHAMGDMAKIAGQKPVVTLARKSIAGFKIREEWPIGCKVTLRSGRMFDFLDRLINVAIPRVRDFRGIPSRSFDGRGNFSMGVKEQIIFPEIDYDKVDSIRGLDICITTSATNDEAGRALLEEFNFPLRQRA